MRFESSGEPLIPRSDWSDQKASTAPKWRKNRKSKPNPKLYIKTRDIIPGNKKIKLEIKLLIKIKFLNSVVKSVKLYLCPKFIFNYS